MATSVPRRDPLRLLTLAFLVAGLVVLLPFAVPLILAAWSAEVARPLIARLERALHGRRGAATTVTVLLLVAIVGPLASAITLLAMGADELFAEVRSAVQGGSLAALLAPTMPTSEGSLELVRRYGVSITRVLAGTFRGTARVAIGFVVFLAGVYSLSAHRERLRSWLESSTPVSSRAFERLAAAFSETGRGLIIGVGLTALAQGLVATAAYLAVGVPHAPVFGFLTAVAALIPAVGTSIVWVPIALALVAFGHPVRGLILAAVGVGIISVIDNVLRPVLARYGNLQLPTFVVFLSMLGGILTFGGTGIVLGPLLIRMAIEALAMARDEHLFQRSVPPAPERPDRHGNAEPCARRSGA